MLELGFSHTLMACIKKDENTFTWQVFLYQFENYTSLQSHNF